MEGRRIGGLAARKRNGKESKWEGYLLFIISNLLYSIICKTIGSLLYSWVTMLKIKKTCHLLNLAINNVSKRIYDDISKKTCLLIFLKLRLWGSRLDSKEILDTYTVFKFLEWPFNLLWSSSTIDPPLYPFTRRLNTDHTSIDDFMYCNSKPGEKQSFLEISLILEVQSWQNLIAKMEKNKSHWNVYFYCK